MNVFCSVASTDRFQFSVVITWEFFASAKKNKSRIENKMILFNNIKAFFHFLEAVTR